MMQDVVYVDPDIFTRPVDPEEHKADLIRASKGIPKGYKGLILRLV